MQTPRGNIYVGVCTKDAIFSPKRTKSLGLSVNNLSTLALSAA
jgi:hypothetical protein